MPDPTPIPNFGLEPAQLLLLVTGAHLRAEIADRPLAYRLAERIHAWLAEHKAALNVPLAPVVCSDLWYMNQEALQSRPTISVGGPGVNALSAYYAQKLNTELVRSNQIVIQLDPEFVDLRVSIWGMDHALTIAAVDHFAGNYLEKYLRAVATQVEPQTDE